ncbi:MAG: hypothetical protein HPY57_12775 [Ignavibacteria bacterium]|nr:hypothetical protein [Ignavibacteria bacterium]
MKEQTNKLNEHYLPLLDYFYLEYGLKLTQEEMDRIIKLAIKVQNSIDLITHKNKNMINWNYSSKLPPLYGENI